MKLPALTAVLFLSMPAAADVNTPFNLYPLYGDVQVSAPQSSSPMLYLRYTGTDGKRYCRVIDTSNITPDKFPRTGDEWESLGTYFAKLSINVVGYTVRPIQDDEKAWCFNTWPSGG